MSRRTRQSGEEIAAENQQLAMQKKRTDLERQLREKEELLHQYRSSDRSNSYANLQAQITQIRAQLDQQSIPRIQPQAMLQQPTTPQHVTTAASAPRVSGAAPVSARYHVPPGKTLRDVVWEQKKAQWVEQQSARQTPAATPVGPPPQRSAVAQPSPQHQVMMSPQEAQQQAARFGRRATPPAHQTGQRQQQAPAQQSPQQLVDTGRPPSFGRRGDSSKGGQQQGGTRPW